jgi:hypothetical protein
MLTLGRTPLSVLGWTPLPLLRWPTLLWRPGIRSWAIVVAWPVIGSTQLSGRALALIGLAVQRAIRLPVSWSRTDLEFIQLVPLFVRAIPLGDGKEFANPTTRINN